MGVLIDTNVIVAWERREHHLKVEELKAYAPMFVSAVTVGELYAGIYRSNAPDRIRRKEQYYDALFSTIKILPFEEHAARIYGKIVADMMKSGSITGKNDLMIAATAICYALPVLTADGDFHRIPLVEVLHYETR